jgi:hypothetical protein
VIGVRSSSVCSGVISSRRARWALTALAAGALGAAGGAPADARPGAPLIGYGNAGTGVKCVQYELKATVAPNLAVDGIFGAATRTAVRAYQTRLHLSPDGVVGPDTGDYILLGDDVHYGKSRLATCYPVVPGHYSIGSY